MTLIPKGGQQRGIAPTDLKTPTEPFHPSMVNALKMIGTDGEAASCPGRRRSGAHVGETITAWVGGQGR
jgi:hypothetical protein